MGIKKRIRGREAEYIRNPYADRSRYQIIEMPNERRSGAQAIDIVPNVTVAGPDGVIALDARLFNPLMRGRKLGPGAWDYPTQSGISQEGQKIIRDVAREASQAFPPTAVPVNRTDDYADFILDPSQVARDLAGGNTWGHASAMQQAAGMPVMNVPTVMPGVPIGYPGEVGGNTNYTMFDGPYAPFDFESLLGGGK